MQFYIANGDPVKASATNIGHSLGVFAQVLYAEFSQETSLLCRSSCLLSLPLFSGLFAGEPR